MTLSLMKARLFILPVLRALIQKYMLILVYRLIGRPVTRLRFSRLLPDKDIGLMDRLVTKKGHSPLSINLLLPDLIFRHYMLFIHMMTELLSQPMAILRTLCRASNCMLRIRMALERIQWLQWRNPKSPQTLSSRVSVVISLCSCMERAV